jgi:hypothetical protein
MPMESAFQARSPRIHRPPAPRKTTFDPVRGAAKVAKAGNSGGSITAKRKDGRETEHEKLDFAHCVAILRAAASTTYYG